MYMQIYIERERWREKEEQRRPRLFLSRFDLHTQAYATIRNEMSGYRHFGVQTGVQKEKKTRKRKAESYDEMS